MKEINRRELFQRIVPVPLTVRRLSECLLSGEYRSVFRGRGIEFDEIRRYIPGDDVRAIDRNVSARFGFPHVRTYREEKELSVCLVLDQSRSMHAPGGGGRTRYEQALKTAALVAFSAELSGQRVGALFFDRGITRVDRPRKGRAHLLSLLCAALQDAAGRRGTGLGEALAGAGRLLKRRSLVVVLSDFFALGWEEDLGRLARRHDVIALAIESPLDRRFPRLGLLPLEDPETGLLRYAPTYSRAFHRAWERWQHLRRAAWEEAVRKAGAAPLSLSTVDDPAAALLRFFQSRGRV